MTRHSGSGMPQVVDSSPVGASPVAADDATPSPTGWQGAVQLHYDDDLGKTRLLKAWHQAPLKVQRPFYPESERICHTVLIHTAGGMVGGDRLDYHIEVAPKAHALVTTAAAGKIYRAQQQQTEQVIEIHLAPGACLEWLPQETILFSEAQFQQKMKVYLAPGAHWLGWDIYRFGRTARGEKFLGGHWRSHTEVWQEDRPLWIDRQWLPGEPHILDHYHGLHGCSVVGTLVWLGTAIPSEMLAALRSSKTDISKTETSAPDIAPAELGLTRLPQGLVCRYRGNSTAEARQWFTQIWNEVRSYGLGHLACPPRVWQR